MLLFGYTVYGIDRVIVSVLVEPIKAEFGLSDTSISLLSGMAITIPFALTCIPMGMLADRVNRTKMLVCLITGWSLLTGAAGLATTVLLLYISRIGVGALESGFAPTALSMLSDTFDRKLRATAMGIFSLGGPLGSFISLALGGYVAAHYGWRAAFFIAALPGLVLAIAILLSIREPQRGRFDANPTATRVKAVPIRDVLRYIWDNRALRYVMAGLPLLAAPAAAITIWTPSYLMRVHNVGVDKGGLIAAVVIGLVGALGALASGFIADRLSRIHEWKQIICVLLGSSLSVVFSLLTFVVQFDPLWLVVSLLAMMSFFVQFYSGPGWALTANLAAAEMRGTVMSVLLILFNLGAFGVGSLFIGLVSDALSGSLGSNAIAVALASSSIFSLLGMIFFSLAMLEMRRQSNKPKNS